MGLPRLLYESRFRDAIPVASGTAAEFNVLNLRDWRPFTKWQPDTLPATVTVDSGAAAKVNYWGVWMHDLNTQGATIELRKSNDDFSGNDILVDTFTPTTDDPFVRFVTTADERYWRIRITGTTVPTLGIVLLGSLFEIPVQMTQGHDPIGRTPISSFNRSVTGNPLGRVTDYQFWEEDLSFSVLEKTWVRDTFLPAWNAHIKDDPYIFMSDHENFPTDLFLVSTEGGFSAPDITGTLAMLDFKVQGLVA